MIITHSRSLFPVKDLIEEYFDFLRNPDVDNYQSKYVGDDYKWADALLNCFPSFLDECFEAGKDAMETAGDYFDLLSKYYMWVEYPGEGNWFINEEDPNKPLDFKKSKGIYPYKH